MTTTQISENITPDHIAAVVTRDGQRVGHVVARARGVNPDGSFVIKFEAHRKTAPLDGSIRRYAQGFKTVESAAKWVAA